MYNVMIVDDERRVRERIKDAVPWEELGLRVIGEAENGARALEMMAKEVPHIVLTDVLMPEMNGLELARHLRDGFPHIKVAILSAYDDFKYAQEAIAYGVKGYLLKPLRKAECKELFYRLAGELRADRRHVEQEDAEEHTLVSLIKGEDKLHEESAPSTPGYASAPAPAHTTTGLPLPLHGESPILKPFVRVAVCLFDRLTKNEESLAFYRELLTQARAFWQPHDVLVLFYGNSLVLFFHDSKPIAKGDTLPVLEKFKDRIRSQMSGGGAAYPEMTIGVGNLCARGGGIKQSYSEAIFACSNKFFSGRDSMIFFQDLHDGEGQRHGEHGDEAIVKVTNELIQACFSRNEHAIHKSIFDFFQIAEKAGGSRMQDIQLIYSEFILSFAIKAREKGASLYRMNRKEALAAIQGFGTLSELKQWFKHEVLTIASSLTDSRTDDANRYVAAAKEYVHKHYAAKIALEDIADVLHLNPVYFSFMFKKATGQNFVDYVNAVRVEKASELIKTTDYRIKDIAVMVGYANFSYFNKVFKKITGIKPLIYRANDSAEE